MGVETNYKQAAKWFRKAAEQGIVRSQNRLGYLYNKGLGVEKNYKQAAKWYLKAAGEEYGHYSAQSKYYLALLYIEGQGVERNVNTAKMWFKRSCAAGIKEACSKL